MCFSERVSWITFGVSMLGVMLALRSGNPRTNVLAYSLAVAGSMQAFEALLWRDPSNRGVAQLASIVNHAQPLVFWALSAFLTPKSPAAAARARVAITAYLAVALPYTLESLRRPTMVNVGPNGLEWAWNHERHYQLVYVLFLTSLCATADAYFDGQIVAIILASFALSYAQYRNTKMVGSMWCFYGAFLPWLLLGK